ncbi:hypothetical protein NGRA_1537 [Nosema granulosis]|uniref:Uncharacterized protein n=1 Tax=Nosema granulosis TaxID=83296 RepID=A0A9P6GYA3_9MICR|nr:hypothetical protein NGRA_1537 [Nosema granulosis]
MVENLSNVQEVSKNDTNKYKERYKKIRNDIYRLELEDKWADAKEFGKIKFILKNSEDTIIEWHKVNFSTKRASLSYDDWKGKLMEAFAQRQRHDEDPLEFLKRLRIGGRELKPGMR